MIASVSTNCWQSTTMTRLLVLSSWRHSSHTCQLQNTRACLAASRTLHVLTHHVCPNSVNQASPPPATLPTGWSVRHVVGCLQPDPRIALQGRVPQRSFSRESLAYYLSDENPPVALARTMLEGVHSWTGLPWWATIALTTWCLRSAITVPLSVYTSHVDLRLRRLRGEINEKAHILRAEVHAGKKKFGWTDREEFVQFKVNMKRITKDLYVRDNCHPAKKFLLPWVQIPMWISISLALRNLAGALPIRGTDNVVKAPDLAEEGLLWFPNLLLADSTWILPVTVGLLNLAIVEMHALHDGKPSRLQLILTNGLRGLSLLMIPIAACVPSCMSFYWACSSLFGLSQNLVLRLPSVRQACGLTVESETPLKDLARRGRNKFSRIRKNAKSEEKS